MTDRAADLTPQILAPSGAGEKDVEATISDMSPTLGLKIWGADMETRRTA